MDLAPTILALLGCQIPEGLDGTVLDNWLFSPPAVRFYTRFDQSGIVNHGGWSEKDEEEVAERLKNLGYLG